MSELSLSHIIECCDYETKKLIQSPTDSLSHTFYQNKATTGAFLGSVMAILCTLPVMVYLPIAIPIVLVTSGICIFAGKKIDETSKADQIAKKILKLDQKYSNKDLSIPQADLLELFTECDEGTRQRLIDKMNENQRKIIEISQTIFLQKVDSQQIEIFQKNQGNFIERNFTHREECKIVAQIIKIEEQCSQLIQFLKENNKEENTPIVELLRREINENKANLSLIHRWKFSAQITTQIAEQEKSLNQIEATLNKSKTHLPQSPMSLREAAIKGDQIAFDQLEALALKQSSESSAYPTFSSMASQNAFFQLGIYWLMKGETDKARSKFLEAITKTQLADPPAYMRLESQFEKFSSLYYQEICAWAGFHHKKQNNDYNAAPLILYGRDYITKSQNQNLLNLLKWSETYQDNDPHLK